MIAVAERSDFLIDWTAPDGARRPLCGFVDAGAVLFNLRDVYEALAVVLPPLLDEQEPHRGVPGEHSFSSHKDGVAWPVANAIQALHTLDVPKPARESLGGFLADWAARMAGFTPESLLLPRSAPRERFVVPAEAAGTWSVGEAAEVLSRDPVISLSRRALFEWLRAHHWTEKRRLGGFDAWAPSAVLLQLGYVRTVDVYVPRRDRPAYPQIRLTDAGLQALHIALGGVAALRLEPVDLPQLVEDLGGVA